MTTDLQSTVTRLLREVSDGRRDAVSELMPLLYEELRSLAGSAFRDERHEHTLQPTALVHEAFIRLAGTDQIRAQSRLQFLALASTAMRNTLVDHARGRARQKRGGGDRPRMPLTLAIDQVAQSQPVDVLALHDALDALAKLDERKARLVELRFFGGLTNDQAAEVLGIARSTVAEDWRMARAWLGRAMHGADHG